MNYNFCYNVSDDENRNKTGRTKVRHRDTLEKGEFIIGVQAIIINSKKQILIWRIRY